MSDRRKAIIARDGLVEYGMVKMAEKLTFEPTVRFQSSFFPRYRQDLTKTLKGLIWFCRVWYGEIGPKH